ncbi:helix-turn-helix domain-containing protein, partial [Iodobacter arcticus]
MPWNEVKPMDEKVKFIAEYLRGDLAFKTLCLLYGISRKTGYKWVQRYHALGINGLQWQSRRPTRRRVQRTPRSIQPLKAATSANQLWSVDYKGQF